MGVSVNSQTLYGGSDRWIIDGFVRFASGVVAALSLAGARASDGIPADLAFLFVAGPVVALGYYLIR